MSSAFILQVSKQSTEVKLLVNDIDNYGEPNDTKDFFGNVAAQKIAQEINYKNVVVVFTE